MSTTHARPALPHRALSGARIALVAAIAALAVSGAYVPIAPIPPAEAADRLKKANPKTRAFKTKCPARFVAKCERGQRTVCLQNDSKGCCIKSICG